jgi:hypothetical protein
MIKFFRKIRQKMLNENKTGKYLKYAFGEIVLVMIGILLALQVNTWNESKKSNVKFNKLLVNVFNDLKVDLEIAQSNIDFYKYKDSLANNIINGKLSVSDYKNNPRRNSIIFGYWGFRVTNMGYNALMQNTENIPSEYEQLIVDLNRQYIVTAERMEISLTVFASIVESARTRYALNFPWYSQNDSVSNEKRWQHLANNPIYKNEAQLYKRYGVMNFSNFVADFYNQGLPLLLTLKAIINDTNPLPSFFPKNADGFDSVKSDYLGKYLTPNGDELIVNEIYGYLFIYFNDIPRVILSMISKDKFKDHRNGWTLSFIRDESNKVIGWSDGFNTIKKIDVND